jgi:regulator of chromosome condensation
MPPRRKSTAIAASGDVKPEPKKQTVKSVATAAAPGTLSRSRSMKRVAGPEDENRDTSPAPPTKRRKAEPKVEEPVTKTETKTKAAVKKVTKAASIKKEESVTEKSEKKAEKKTEKKAEKVKVPKDYSLFNPLPSPSEHLRPAPVLFVWGAGNFGQFGMGEDNLGEYEKPTRNKLVEEKMAEGAFGEQGAGLEAVAAGGMYSLFLDEQGTVSKPSYKRPIFMTDTDAW